MGQGFKRYICQHTTLIEKKSYFAFGSEMIRDDSGRDWIIPIIMFLAMGWRWTSA